MQRKYDIKYFLAKNPAHCHNNNQPTALLLAATIKTGIIKVNKVASGHRAVGMGGVNASKNCCDGRETTKINAKNVCGLPAVCCSTPSCWLVEKHQKVKSAYLVK